MNRFKKGLALTMAVTLLAMSSWCTVAEARRMGGGRSFGRQAPAPSIPRQNQAYPSNPQPVPAQRQAVPPAPVTGQQPARNRWLGPLTGLAAGLGIAALLSHFGMGEAFSGMLGNILLIALAIVVVMWLVRKFRGSTQAPTDGRLATSGAGWHGGTVDNPTSPANVTHRNAEPQPYPPTGSAGQSAASAYGVGSATPQTANPAAVHTPADFDVTAFLQSAKQVFVRMQAAYDSADTSALREFTTDDVLVELQKEIIERGGRPNVTEVVALNAELVGFDADVDEQIASVHFSGSLREEVGHAAQPFEEIWNLTRPTHGRGGWLLSGMQSL